MAGLGIFGVVALYFTYKDAGEIRKEVTQRLINVEDKTDKTIGILKGDVKEIKGETKDAIDSAKRDAREAVISTRDVANSQREIQGSVYWNNNGV